MGTSAEALRRDIEDTRSNMSRDLDAIGDRVSPRRMAERKVARTRRWMGDVRERVFGVTEHMAHSAHDVSGAVGEKAEHAKDAVTGVPDAAMRRTQGSPVAAGAVAFGVGFLASMVFGASEAEQRAVGALEERAEPLIEPVKGHLTQAAHTVADDVKQQGTQAAQELRDEARDRAGAVKEQAAGAAQDVRRVAGP